MSVIQLVAADRIMKIYDKFQDFVTSMKTSLLSALAIVDRVGLEMGAPPFVSFRISRFIFKYRLRLYTEFCTEEEYRKLHNSIICAK